MKTPASVIKREIKRHFPFRGIDCICMTKSEFQKRWDSVVFEISKKRYTSELLESYRSKIESKVAWIPEEYVPPKIVEPKTQIVVIPKRLKWNDGYDILRDTKPKILKWKVRN